MRQPIKVEAHSLIDYGFLVGALAGPPALGLRGAGRTVPWAFGAVQGTLNALTDQRYALRRVVPFKLHGRSESLAVPGLAVAVAVAVTGAANQRHGKAFFGGMLAALATVYTLTDWDARPVDRRGLRRLRR